MAGPAPPVPTLCPDSSLAAGQATAIAPHPLPRPWSSPAVVMLTVKLASGVRFSAVDACGVPFYSGQATARLRGRFAVQTPESLLRPSLPSRCTAASPHPYRCLSPSWPRSSRPFLHAPPAKEIDGRRRESISLLLGVPRSSSAAPRQQEKPSKWMFDQNSKGKAVKAIKVDV